jgi:3-oxoacyl-[acyl-carrier protein] reductase
LDLQLQQKRAIITGGSRGIGLGIARALAQEGCAVGLIARGEGDLLQAAKTLTEEGHVAFYASADVTQTESLDRAIQDLA